MIYLFIENIFILGPFGNRRALSNRWTLKCHVQIYGRDTPNRCVLGHDDGRDDSR